MNKSDIIREELKQFPQIASATLAKKLYGKYPELWSSLESCRSAIRYVRGNSGEAHRNTSDQKFHRPNGKAGETFYKLPKPKTSLRSWKIHKITGDHKALVMGDLHVPYYDPLAVEIAVNNGKKHEVDLVILNGDTLDFFSISQWEKDPRERNFPQEIKSCQQFLGWLREQFPKARIIFKVGNHEERYEKYLIKKAPELLGIPNFELCSILGFEDLGIELVDDMRPIKLNELVLLHGHEYRFSISNPVNPARGLYLRAKVNALTNHFHQASSHSEPNLEGKVISCYSLGCLSELRPKYMPLNKWVHGFAIVEMSGRKEFNVLNQKIIDAKIHPA